MKIPIVLLVLVLLAVVLGHAVERAIYPDMSIPISRCASACGARGVHEVTTARCVCEPPARCVCEPPAR